VIRYVGANCGIGRRRCNAKPPLLRTRIPRVHVTPYLDRLYLGRVTALREQTYHYNVSGQLIPIRKWRSSSQGLCDHAQGVLLSSYSAATTC
jgi:hypothetical protein